MKTLFPIALSMSRRRFGGLIAVAVAVLIGALAVTATAGIAQTGIWADAPVGRFASADVLVGAAQTVEQEEDIDVPLPEREAVGADLVATLATVPGIEHALGDLSFPATPVLDGTPVHSGGGHGWSSASLPDTPKVTGEAPDAAGELVLDLATATALGGAPGDRIEIVVAGQRATYQVTGIAEDVPPGLYFADDVATALAGREGRVDLIALWATPGTDPGDAADRVRDALAGTGLTVATGDDRGDVESLAVGAGRGLLIALAGSLAGVILMIVGFIVTGALAVSVAGQRRDLALIRAVGATPRQVRRIAAIQGTLAALLVLPPGITAGYFLAERAREWFVRLGVIPESLPLVTGPLPAIVTAVLFLAVVGLGARGAALRVSRMPATEAVAQTETEPRSPGRIRTTIGFALIGLAMLMAAVPLVSRSMVAVAGTGSAGIVAVIGLTLAGPAVVRAAAEFLAARLSRRPDPAGWLAAQNLRAFASRGAGALTGLAMAVTLAITYTFAQTSPQKGVEQDLAASDLGALSVTAPGLGGVPAYALDDLRAVPGATVAIRDSTTVVLPHTEDGRAKADAYETVVLGADAESMVDLGLTAGSMSALTGDSIAVSGTFSMWQGLDPGDTTELILADGSRVTVTVAAVYDRELGYGDIVLSPDVAYPSASLYDSVLVGGVAEQTVRDALAGVPGVAVDAGPREVAAEVTPQMWLNFVVVGGLLGYVLLGVINSLVAATSRRGGEFDALRFAGATPGQMRAMIRREGLWYGLGACAAGLALSTPPLLFLGVGLLGSPIAAGPWWLPPGVCAVVLVAGYLATVIPAGRVLRAVTGR
ncbi:FtsX-like permease family protein [Phytomonospora endophytica]|uniref:Putative ABC transport system permease protein n=1 Tax=Phytomonospora endophytica TaxID=714109 RepID=A0A841FIZ4_9ACTN|nr:FtsX-like permease family protein [Phytomonospora endophytica]MBB6032619.1 putative ABC transport system permease protein [Phytomonospora endophytica]GIG66231.1 membrane protein [Phytomonospora endophytica]